MKKSLSSLILLVLLVTLVVPASAEGPTVTFVNPVPGDVLTLAVGESYTLEVHVSSDVAFIRAQMALDQFYPGRYVTANGMVGAHKGTEATMQITLTGKGATAELPGGIAPVSLIVGVRYQGGNVVVETYDFGVIVQ
ncbi:MAG: hypothetical protein JXA10_18465 [Anaerolineae bacterium]|nr:hypothetical protein [Anaerolineae bacterium]